MRRTKKQWLRALEVVGLCLLCAAQPFTGHAKNGQGSMTVSSTSVNAGSLTNFSFQFSAPKKGFTAGSQATLLIPAGWSAPQTNNASGLGFVQVTPAGSGSTASLAGIAGSGPWTVTVNFSLSQNQSGFTVGYQNASVATNAGVYVFTTQSKASGGVLTTLRSGSPTVTVNNMLNTNTTTTVSSGLNPSTYGNWVTFIATVTGAGPGTLSGTVTFKVGDVVMGITALGSSGQATFSTNRFSVADSPVSITAVYSGNAQFNPSVSAILYQTVNPVSLTITGLAANNKIYDGGTGAGLNTNNVTLLGVLAGDNVSLDTSLAVASFADPNAGSQKTVTVAGLALAGADSGNYVLGSIPSLLADIQPAPLLVNANNTNRLFGAANPAFTAAYSGFVNGEGPSVLSGTPAFSTTANPSSTVAGSPYPIAVTNGTLTANNYSFVFVSGSLTVLPGVGQPQRILSIAALPNGSVTLVCGGAAGQTYLLQAASDLSSSAWSTIATNTTDVNGSMTCTDPSAPSFPSRFYRTRLP